jgi:hypothetical protein
MINRSKKFFTKFKLFFNSKLVKIVFRSISILSNYFISMLEIQVELQQRSWQKPQQKNQQQKKLQKRNNQLKQNFFL